MTPYNIVQVNTKLGVIIVVGIVVPNMTTTTTANVTIIIINIAVSVGISIIIIIIVDVITIMTTIFVMMTIIIVVVVVVVVVMVVTVVVVVVVVVVVMVLVVESGVGDVGQSAAAAFRSGTRLLRGTKWGSLIGVLSYAIVPLAVILRVRIEADLANGVRSSSSSSDGVASKTRTSCRFVGAVVKPRRFVVVTVIVCYLSHPLSIFQSIPDALSPSLSISTSLSLTQLLTQSLLLCLLLLLTLPLCFNQSPTLSYPLCLSLRLSLTFSVYPCLCHSPSHSSLIVCFSFSLNLSISDALSPSLSITTSPTHFLSSPSLSLALTVYR
uniref:Uncharacterized protein n=1 Tax=Octopus bimaculoides TaxID=37653 RepID=A0A0L8GR01_OCTBM